MTFCKKAEEINTANGVLTIYYKIEKFAKVGFWFVYYTRNGATTTEEIKGGLFNKPTKKQVQRYIDTYGL